jgi:RNA polymerase sigma-70 factor, ECF subfamily
MYEITSGDQVRPTSANVKEVDVRQDDPSGMVLSSRSDDLTAWLVAARGGDSVALGDLLQAFRPYLSSIAERDAQAMLRGKCDVADIVQETLLGAHLGFMRFAGGDVVDFRAWLRGILKHVIADHVRRYRDTRKRTVRRELSLDAYLELCQVRDEPVDPDETPQTRALSKEQAGALITAIERLRPDEKMAILLRSRELLSFQEIGSRLSRSPDAARKLWWRALVRLHNLLQP